MSSPIAQVSKDDQQEPRSSLIRQQQQAALSSNSKGPDGEKEGEKKKKKKGFFRVLLCCFVPMEDNQNKPGPYKREGLNQSADPIEYLLPPQSSQDVGRKTLVLDLDETLVHSSFKPIPNADFIVPVEIENQIHQVYVAKRPGVDQFLKIMGEKFEIVVFTASLAKYADPVLDLLDKSKVVGARLFREACSNHKGNYVKDLGRLGRALRHTIIVDNSPASYMFHPENAVPIESWFDDETDTELLDLIPFLEDMAKVDNVCAVLDTSHR
eukprot:TRINITY_DN2197_c0_g2_i1.p1 TRINITY_DN2197_c0_g2~~TRINITY_DN2197_c0_g2_i1.p1  ORF type:complete len:268 (-),score=34.30 TRINITY_DN2197_c0_g2_i1:499-1302(-)